MQIKKNELTDKSISAAYWGVIGTFAQIFIQLGAQICLARILGPEQYGIFAVGAIVISFSNFFSDIGIAYGLIQKKFVTNNDLQFVSTWQFFLGVIVAGIITLLSADIANLFGDKGSRDVIKWLSLVCFFNAISATSLSMLKRGLDFKYIKISQLVSYIIGYLFVGIPLALNGNQVWALVFAWVAQSVSMFLMYYIKIRHPLKPTFWYQDAKGLSNYGIVVLATNLTNWLINNIDRVVVGRFFSAHEMGVYTTPYNILFNPTTSLISIIQPIFFSATSRISEQSNKIEGAYRGLVGLVCLFLMPVFAVVAVISDTFIVTIYGQDWKEAAAIFRPLALVMPLFIIWSLSTPMLWVGGHTSREFKSQLPIAILWVAFAVLAAKFSIVAVAWACLIFFVFRCLVIVSSVVILLGYDVNALLISLRGGFVLSFVMAGMTSVVDSLLRSTFCPIFVCLLIDLIFAFFVMFLFILNFPSLRSAEVNFLLSRLIKNMPSKITYKINNILGL